ncbi:MAG: VWA domain-containing protein [Candidatus Nanoarchaeia archaeon]|nr:VWA domain-containing protein [Candidatus Nanoarchaeia archaeon]
MDIEFLKPQYLLLLAIIPLIIFVHFYSLKHGRKQALKFANFDAIKRVTGETVVAKNALLLAMRIIAVVALVLAASGTKIWYEGQSVDYDMVLAIDASSSMLAEDYKPNRMEATRAAVLMFIDSMPSSAKIGLITFSGAAYVHALPTDDMNKLTEIVHGLEIQKLGGTDIGTAIITSANMLAGGDRPKAVVLLSDGQSNIGVNPMDALEYIKGSKVVINTIGIGTSEGGIISDIGAAFKLDEETLQEVAAATGGQYFRPTDEASLMATFTQIASLKDRPIGKDISIYLLFLAVFLLFIEWGLISTKYKII